MDTPKNPAVADSLVGRELDASPLHHVKKGIAPAILFHGTADQIVPIADAEALCLRCAMSGAAVRLCVTRASRTVSPAAAGAGPGMPARSRRPKCFCDPSA